MKFIPHTFTPNPSPSPLAFHSHPHPAGAVWQPGGQRHRLRAVLGDLPRSPAVAVLCARAVPVPVLLAQPPRGPPPVPLQPPGPGVCVLSVACRVCADLCSLLWLWICMIIVGLAIFHQCSYFMVSICVSFLFGNLTARRIVRNICGHCGRRCPRSTRTPCVSVLH